MVHVIARTATVWLQGLRSTQAVIKKDSAKKTAKKSRVKCFIKLVNYQHLMPTRYTLDVDLKDVVTADCLSTKDKKITACKETKARFEERFKTGKNRWFFTKLRF
jgi:large subunit ribosomal protein L27e